MSLVNKRIVCQSCKKSYYETTNRFDPKLPINGSMVKSLDNLRKENLWGFPETEATKSGMMECPACGSLLYHNQRVVLEDDRPAVKKITPEFNDIILQRKEEGRTATEIAEEFNFSKQAVGRRIYDLKKDK